MSVLSPINCFSGGAKAFQSDYLYSGAVQPYTVATVVSPRQCFLGIAFPQHLSGQSQVTSFLFSGALQPFTPSTYTFDQIAAHVGRKVEMVGY